MAEPVPGSALRVARVRAGWRVGALATAAGINPATLWRIETGRTKNLKDKTRKALAAKLGADIFGANGGRD